MTYQLVNRGTLLLGNDAPSKSVGVGTILIKMHDGIVKTLSDVWQIPKLKENLISLGSSSNPLLRFAGIFGEDMWDFFFMKSLRKSEA